MKSQIRIDWNEPVLRPHPIRSETEARELILKLIARRSPPLKSVRVHFNRNHSTMLSRSQKDQHAVLRLHNIFRSAPEEVLEGVVRCFFTRLHRRTARRIRVHLKDFVELHHREVLRPIPSRRGLPPLGSTFDLQVILERVYRSYFPGSNTVEIAWSRRILKRLMGKWIENPPRLPNLILINRLLDTPEVPQYYIEFLVFHELLHEAIPAHRRKGHWVHHSAEFRRREREFPDYRRAIRWEEDHLEKLYRKRHRQRPG